jgi:hypothetical protein
LRETYKIKKRKREKIMACMFEGCEASAPLYLYSVCYELDGEMQDLNVPLSATSCRALAERIMAENEFCAEVRVIDNYTGEVVYHAIRSIRIEVEIEVYDNIGED